MTEGQKTPFSGIDRLLGNGSVDTLSMSHVLVVGLGGVGSWAVEALARSGLGFITLVDYDEICVSNINRQLHALTSTIGKSKAKALKERIHDINPECQVTVIEDFFSSDSAEQILATPYNIVIDAIDALSAKALLAKACRDKSIPLIVTGGAGGKKDPTKIAIEDLAKTMNDPLLQKLRKYLRQKMDFPRGKRSQFGIIAIYSTELPNEPENCEITGGSLDCATGYGTATYITATFGFFAAYKAVEYILKPKQ